MNNTLWSLFEKVSVLAFGLLPFMFITRNFDKVDIGIYALVSMLLTSVWSLSSGGIKPIYIKYVVKYPNSFIRNFAQIYLLIKSCILIILISVFTVFLEFEKTGDSYVYIAMAIYSITFLEPLLWQFELELNQRRVFLVRLVTSILFFIIKLYVIFNTNTLNSLLVVIALESFVFYMFLYYVRHKRFTPLKKINLNFRGWRFIFKKSFPLFISQLLVLTYMRIDQMMISFLSSPSELADYSVTLRIIEPFNILPLAICSTALPILASLKGQGEELLIKAKGYFFLLFFLGLTISLILAVFGEGILGLLFGSKFSQLGPLVCVLAFTVMFNFVAVYNGMLLTIIDRQGLAPKRALIGVFINVTLNLLLIPELGSIGAAIATLFTIALSGCIFYYCSKKTLIIRDVNFLGVFSYAQLKKIKF